MRVLWIGDGGQVTLPASVLRARATDRLLPEGHSEDHDDHPVLRPAVDPVEAATGVITVDDDLTAVRAAYRAEDEAAMRRRLR